MISIVASQNQSSRVETFHRILAFFSFFHAQKCFRFNLIIIYLSFLVVFALLNHQTQLFSLLFSYFYYLFTFFTIKIQIFIVFHSMNIQLHTPGTDSISDLLVIYCRLLIGPQLLKYTLAFMFILNKLTTKLVFYGEFYMFMRE